MENLRKLMGGVKKGLREVEEDSDIYAVDERSVGKFSIVILQNKKNNMMRSAIMKKDKMKRFNRNKQEDIDRLWDLATKYKGKEITEIINF